MCAIAGFVTSGNPSHARETALQMVRTLKHRGPDAEGVWTDPDVGVALAHQRLSILDLSDAGAQPMISHSGRYVITFNGEIYNFKELRARLANQGTELKGSSDTEVILAFFEEFGLKTALSQMRGMFAFALWDRQERQLWLARDRMGEKPLYYAFLGKTLLFASELKAFSRHPDWTGASSEINTEAMTSYLRYGYVPSPFSIFKGAKKLSPGTCVKADLKTGTLVIGEPEQYWDLNEVSTLSRSRSASEPVTKSELKALLSSTVREQMVSDVPIGAFLSGGIDSSLIVALMQSASSSPINTFTIGFNDDDFNEAAFAKKIATHLGTSHRELYVSPKEALEVVPLLPQIYDEPFADPSQIPTFLISKLASQHVKVSLSGDAGDELFGGYNRYLFVDKIWDKIRWLPRPLRKQAGKILSAISPEILFSVSPSMSLQREKIAKLSAILDAKDPHEIYLRLVSLWQNPSEIVLNSRELPTLALNAGSRPTFSDSASTQQFLDQRTYLPDDILTKVDRASMAVGLESRVPFLDPRVIALSWRLTSEQKFRNGKGKWLLRQVLSEFVPLELFDRPKTGFGVPIGSWLRGPLVDWAENLLSEKRLKSEGYFDVKAVRSVWENHRSGKKDGHYPLWAVLMFQAWKGSV